MDDNDVPRREELRTLRVRRSLSFRHSRAGGNPGFPNLAGTNLDARFRGHDDSSRGHHRSFWQGVKCLAILVVFIPFARPLGAITIVGDAGDGITAIDVENGPGDITGALGREKNAGLYHIFRSLGSA